ncbi:MAG: hypothetical protein ACOY3P_19480 [Planctomycetota bacterium]
MELEQRDDGWWITGVPDTVTECGPYQTKALAESDRRGLERTFKHFDDPAFWTIQPGNGRAR